MSLSASSDFEHGDNFEWGIHVVIEPDVTVGDNVTLGHNVVLKSGTRIGDNVDFADYCRTTGLCIIGNNVNVRTGATISRGVIVEDYCFIGPGVMTNHTKHVNLGRSDVPKVQYVTRIGFGSVVGSQSLLLAGVRLVPHVILGGGSVVVKSVYEPGVYVGNPLKKLGGVPEEYWIDIDNESTAMKDHFFNAQLVQKYMPELVNELPHKNIAEGGGDEVA